ncbi:hypothetical protein VNO78_25273 [Psophocarpus tetragonolobus]|uniref:Uncharacterized protein n=1 Tax=Psophocarpus tetragonolobus TaxID=3891 RepID=A0AAN9S6M1_PSOTE
MTKEYCIKIFLIIYSWKCCVCELWVLYLNGLLLFWLQSSVDKDNVSKHRCNFLRIALSCPLKISFFVESLEPIGFVLWV